MVQLNSSWCVRVHRDELVEFQVDGTRGSAVAGLHKCVVQPREVTPKPVWDPDLKRNGPGSASLPGPGVVGVRRPGRSRSPRPSAR